MAKKKYCFKCGQNKWESEFHNDRSRADGKHVVCKECNKEYARIWRAKKKLGLTGNRNRRVTAQPIRAYILNVQEGVKC